MPSKKQKRPSKQLKTLENQKSPDQVDEFAPGGKWPNCENGKGKKKGKNAFAKKGKG
jgi:hypothetical protein